jgi:hypothetical protein
MELPHKDELSLPRTGLDSPFIVIEDGVTVRMSCFHSHTTNKSR